MRKISTFFLILIAGQINLCAATYTVGSGKTYATIGAVPVLAAGDVVEIYAGTYTEYKKWTVSGTAGSPITIKGMGTTKPIIDGTGLDLLGVGAVPRALFQFEGSYYVVDNLEFKKADNTTSHNGAGIRISGGNNITVRNCKITTCENGIMSDNCSNIVMEYSELSDNGSPDYPGYTHNTYFGGTSITVRYCYIHDSVSGQNLKTRAHYNEILYNYIADANSGEVDMMEAAGFTDVANSNSVLIGNVIIKRDAAPKSGVSGNNTKYITFGQDSGGTRTGTLYMINNTIISGMTSNIPIALSSTTKAVCYNNIFYGTDTLLKDAYTISNTTGANNWLPATATVPTGFTFNVQGVAPGFIQVGARDYHLDLSAICINAGNNSPEYKDGSGVTHSAIPTLQYVNHLSCVTRASDTQLDIGAFEYGSGSTGGGSSTDPFVNTKAYPNPLRLSNSTDKMFKLINLPAGSTIDIYDMSGSKIRSLREVDYGYGRILWDGKNANSEYACAGIYPFVITDTLGNKKKGKLAFLK